MLKLPKLTDYAVIILGAMAAAPTMLHTTNSLAETTLLPTPTVAKILKHLGKSGVLSAQRGTHGGYRLSRPATAITVADIVEALDGPVAVTDCADNRPGNCLLENSCTMHGHWNTINRAIRGALEAVSLADMLASPFPPRSITAAAQTTPP